MRTLINDDGIRVFDISSFSLRQTFECGQCFRWKLNSSGNWCGVVKNIYRELRQEIDGFTIIGADEKEFYDIWYDYFDLNNDYDEIKRILSGNSILKDAISFSPGIRVLHQDTWEAFISFIISQNNNITRIKGIIDKLCYKYGKEIKNGFYSFPDIESIANAKIEDLYAIGCGYRSEYIYYASKDVLNGNINLDEIKKLSSEEARKILLGIYGIGPKVADCILLYGMGKLDRCPADIWMKRVLAKFNGELPECANGNIGIAQQFLFNYARNFQNIFK